MSGKNYIYIYLLSIYFHKSSEFNSQRYGDDSDQDTDEEVLPITTHYIIEDGKNCNFF